VLEEKSDPTPSQYDHGKRTVPDLQRKKEEYRRGKKPTSPVGGEGTQGERRGRGNNLRKVSLNRSRWSFKTRPPLA